MVIQDLVFFNEIITAEQTDVSGGVDVETSNTISRGRLRLNVNLREVLVDGKNFNGEYADCSADFNDFTGDLEISCTGLPGAKEDPGQILLSAPLDL